MPTTWKSDVRDSLDKAFTAAAEHLTSQGVAVRHYVVPHCEGYMPVTGVAADVWCLEVDFGPAIHHPGESVTGLFQVFDPAFPNLGLAFMGQRRNSDGTPVSDHRLPRWRYRQDNLWCYTVMPVVNSMLAPLDPTGQGHSQHVGVYHGSVTGPDYLTVPSKVLRLRADARRRGQLAIIWSDFQAPFSELAVRLIGGPLARSWPWHLTPRAAHPSRVRVPALKADGEIGYFQDFSQALESGIGLARGCLSPPTTS